MSINIFTKKEFEEALPKGYWSGPKVEDGEYTYVIHVDSAVGIKIRSSISASTGLSAETGKDSIRAWLFDFETGNPIGKKANAYTTRIPGWQNRLVANEDSVVKKLWTWRKRAGDCPHCNKPLKINKVKADPNRPGKPNVGRIYASCWDCKNIFVWLDRFNPSVFFSEKSNKPIQLEPVLEEKPVSEEKPVLESSPTKEASFVEKSNPPTFGMIGKATSNYVEEVVVSAQKPGNFSYGDSTPNDQQRIAIESPIGQSVRCIAPAGAGKTYVLTWRYNYLLNNPIQPVHPNNILAVTYTKTMADYMYQRILAVNPQVENTHAKNQICTIHALCNRLLYWELGTRKEVAPEWEQKAAVSMIIEKVWKNPDSMPKWKEVFTWIDLAKSNGFVSNDDLPFFRQYCGDYHGKNLHVARQLFDQAMAEGGKKKVVGGYTTFSDMILQVEIMLRNDKAFREKWQKRFAYVIVDEFQDTNFQALRILTTLSLPPGENTIYENWVPGRQSLIPPIEDWR